MNRISSVLHHGATQFGEASCVLYHTEGSPALCGLSYKSAWIVLQKHEKWLSEAIQTKCAANEVLSEVVVAYLSSNSVDLFLSILASANDASTGAAARTALLNTRWTPDEIASALESPNSSDVSILIYGPGYERAAQQASNKVKHSSVCVALPVFSQELVTPLRSPPLMGSRPPYPIQSLRSSTTDDALLVFTSGTTSSSKGVRLGHRALLVQSYQKLRRPCLYSSETTMLASTVPFFHIGGFSSALAVWMAGGAWVVTPDKTTTSFDPSALLKSISHPQVPPNTLVVVPAMLNSILPRARKMFPAVRLVLIGGQSASRPTLLRLASVFPNARVVQTYACTEAASSMTFLEVNPQQGPPTSRELVGDCVGSPPHHVDLQLCSRDSGTNISKAYQIGVICTRGPHVMNGYWKRGDPASKPSNWLVTNDLGFWDETGRLYFSGRLRDVIRTGGETVLASEVERVLLQYDDIRECAVFALPDERFGEAVCAAIVSSKKPLPIRDRCAQHGLAGYKRPRRIFYFDALPRNSSGKVLKHELAQLCRGPARNRL